MNLYKIFMKQCLNIFQLMKKNHHIVNFILQYFSNYSSIFFIVHQKCQQKLRSLCEKLKVIRFHQILKFLFSLTFKNIDDIHTIDNLAHAHIAQCSAENIMLWCQFIQTFGLHETTAIVLGKEYHFKRVRNILSGIYHPLFLYR